MPDLSDKVPIGNTLYRLRIAPAPLLDESGECAMSCIDTDNNELLISSDVPEEKRMIVAAHITLKACELEKSLLHFSVIADLNE